jgi:hypothetical protein
MISLRKQSCLSQPSCEGRIRATLFPALVCVQLIGIHYWYAFPQFHEEFDNWFQLMRFRLRIQPHTIHPNRVFHGYLEFQLMQLLRHMSDNFVMWRVAIYAIFLPLTYLVLNHYREAIYRSRSQLPPTITILGFAFSPAGAYLSDTWNDHLPMLPFYAAGLALLLVSLKLPRYGSIALVFLLHLCFHIAEPWMWACGLGALLLRCKRKDFLAVAVLLLMIAAATMLASTAAGRGFSLLLRYFDTNSRVHHSHFWHLFEKGQSVGGVTPWNLILFLLIYIVMLLQCLFIKMDFRETALWTILVVTALVFPLTYETENPERYWHLSLLWNIISVRIIVGLCNLTSFSQLRSRSGSVLAGFLFILNMSFCVIAACADQSKISKYNEAVQDMPGNKKSTLFLVHQGAFYLWQAYYFPGNVVFIDNLQAMPKLTASRTYYFSNYSAKQLSQDLHLTIQKGIEPDMRLYKLQQ